MTLESLLPTLVYVVKRVWRSLGSGGPTPGDEGDPRKHNDWSNPPFLMAVSVALSLAFYLTVSLTINLVGEPGLLIRARIYLQLAAASLATLQILVLVYMEIVPVRRSNYQRQLAAEKETQAQVAELKRIVETIQNEPKKQKRAKGSANTHKAAYLPGMGASESTPKATSASQESIKRKPATGPTKGKVPSKSKRRRRAK